MSAAGTAPATEAVSSKDAPLRATTTASSTADCKVEKPTAKPRETHHLDASATTRTPPLNGATPAPKDAEPDQPAAQRKENGSALDTLDSGHTLAGKQHAAPSHLEVMSAVDRPLSRPMSPALLQSSAGPRRASSQGQLWSSAEIDTPSSDGTPRQAPALNDSFTQQLMAGAMRLKSSLFKPERISFTDIARNPTLARRARAEMDNHQFKGMIEGQDGAVYEGRPHDLEVTRLQMALDVVEADAEEESRINSQLAQLVCLRLDASRKAVERLLGILQAVTAAEAVYTRSMNAVSRVKLVSECDGATLRAALSRFSDIPWLIGEAHAAVQNGLVDITRSCQQVVAELRRECQSISQESTRAIAAVAAARKSLHNFFMTHRSACRTADDALLERSRSGHVSSAARLDLDPWMTESRVVAAHQALHSAQTHQRLMLATAYERVKQHEDHRCEVLRQIVHSFLHAYKGELGPDSDEEQALRTLMDAIDCDGDLSQFSASAAAAVETGRELAERQLAALEAASQDLLCSPDIIRQGQMARWVSGSGKWADCHFILTRSGFLHWLADAADIAPLGSLNLGKCQFEAGEAPKFNINEQLGGLFAKGRRMCFEASSVEDCCEWAIALRETIAAHKGR